MDRFKITCEIEDRQVEMQFDRKKMPGEAGPSYMVSIDGLFRGYITKGKPDNFVKVLNSDIPDAYMLVINEKINASIVKL